MLDRSTSHLEKMSAIPYEDVFDQSHSIQRQWKPVDDAPSPPALHIEKLDDELESATAALIISRDAHCPRKSSLVKPQDRATRCAKTVRFSSSITVKTIPARKSTMRSGTGLDLVEIMKLTDDEFLPLLAGSRQPDSPAPWTGIGKTRWSSERRSCSLLAPRARKQTGQSSRVNAYHDRRLKFKQYCFSPYCCPTFAVDYLRPADSGTQRLIQRGCLSQNCFRLLPLCQSTPDSRLNFALDLGHEKKASASTIRYRMALSRHSRRMRQRDTARHHETPLRRRRCQLGIMPCTQLVDRASRVACKARAVTSPSRTLHIPSKVNNASDHEPSVSHGFSQIRQASFPERHPATRSLGDHTSRQLKTYVDHIRDQRGPLKRSLNTHCTVGSLSKTMSAVSHLQY